MARPTLYRDHYPEQARKLALLLGATTPQLADFFDVATSTVDLWMTQYPAFSEAIKEGKTAADCEVGASLYKKAIGFEYQKAVPIKLKEVLYENGKRLSETERVEVVMVTEFVPPETTAEIFWLKNRQNASWRDRKDVDVTSLGKQVGVIALPAATWGSSDETVTE